MFSKLPPRFSTAYPKGYMMNDSNNEIPKGIEELAPKASEIILSDFIGQYDLPLAELVLRALKRLPSKGRIRGKKNNRVIIAFSWLINEIPDSEARKDEIFLLYQDALNRGDS